MLFKSILFTNISVILLTLLTLQAALADDITHDSASTQLYHHKKNAPDSYTDEDDDDGGVGGNHGNTGKEETCQEDGISGTQCSVYVTQEWGTRQRHNAVVLGVELASSDQDDEDDEDVRFSYVWAVFML